MVSEIVITYFIVSLGMPVRADAWLAKNFNY